MHLNIDDVLQIIQIFAMYSQFNKQQDNEFRPKINDFIKEMTQNNKRIVCVTSGGTSVPLEQKTVRSIQNFSTGLRGSQLAEKFLENGCAVIFYHRFKSTLPFTQGLSVNAILLSENPNHQLQILKHVVSTHAKYSKNILYLTFQTVYDYLDGALLIRQLLPPRSIYVLCAAVSDFVPKQTPQNKIHTQENLSIELTNSPKILGKLVKQGVLTVSFKLETDESKLSERMQQALEKYKVDCVIGNMLNDKEYVKIINKDGKIDEYHTNVEQNIVQYLLSQLNKLD